MGIDAFLAYAKAFRAELRCAGIEADELVDWGRSYRLPKVVRGGKNQRLFTDFSRLGNLNWSMPTGGSKDTRKTGSGAFAGIGAVKATGQQYKVPAKITQNRNSELVRLVGSLHRNGLTPEAILAAVRTTNEQQCEPPLPDEEIVHMVESSTSWSPPQTYQAVAHAMRQRVVESASTVVQQATKATQTTPRLGGGAKPENEFDEPEETPTPRLEDELAGPEAAPPPPSPAKSSPLTALLRVPGEARDRVLKEMATAEAAEAKAAPAAMRQNRAAGPAGRGDFLLDAKWAIDYHGLPVGPRRIGVLVNRMTQASGPTSAPRFASDSDQDIAEHVLVEMERENYITVFDLGDLWRYHPDLGYWRRVPDAVVEALIMSLHGEPVLTMKGDPRPLLLSNAKIEAVANVVRRAASAQGFYEDQVPGVACENGFATVQDGRVVVIDHDPHHHCLFGLPIRAEENATPELFLQYLRQCFRDDTDCEEKIKVLQEFTGAALMGMSTKYQKGLMLVGHGANGKSTFQTIITALFPKNAVTAVPPQEMDNEYRRAMLAGSRINMVSELPESDILASEAIKAMISGDQVVGRHIREAPFAFRPVAGHIFSANNLPAVTDMTDGFFRRWLIISWDRRFSTAEQDKRLSDRVIGTELGSILSWALRGAARLLERDAYTETASMRTNVQEWRESTDQVSSWLHARYVWPPTPGNPTGLFSSATLYEDFSRWAAMNGHKTMTSTKWGRRMKLLDVPHSRKETGMYYLLERRALVLPGQSPEGK
jgi:P4 family phage/plasmid primase-like protien